MRIVTTCHRAGWEQYGHKCWDGLRQLWPGTEVVWYTEGFALPQQRPHYSERKNEELAKLQEFKAKWKHYIAPDWRYDVVRFANKAYAIYDALRDYDGIAAWWDADIILKKTLPAGYLEELLPNECYIALFKREGWHSECGLWIVDCAHPLHKAVMDSFIGWYETGRFRDAHEWHDSILLDVTLRGFERQNLIKTHNLSGKWSNLEHPMARHPISEYVDHLKGPARKQIGYSPERKVA